MINRLLHIAFWGAITCASSVSLAQTSRTWGVVGETYLLHFSDSINIQPYYINWPLKTNNGVFSSCSGGMLLRDYGYHVLNLIDLTKVYNSDSIYPSYPGNSIMLYRDYSTVDNIIYANNFLFKDDKLYDAYFGLFKDNHDGYLLPGIKSAPSGLFLSTIDLDDMRIQAKNSILVEVPGTAVNSSFINSLEDAKRIADFKYRLALNLNRGAILGDLNEGSFVLRDSLQPPESEQSFDLSSIPIPIPYQRFGKSLFTNIELGRNVDRMFSIAKSSMGMAFNGVVDDELFICFSIYQYDIDRTTGASKGNPVKLISAQSSSHSKSTGDYITYRDLECSPNDSILYFVEDITTRDTSTGTTKITWGSKVRYIDFRDAGQPVIRDLFVLPASNNSPTHIALEISPYGKLIVTYLDNSKLNILQRFMTYIDPNNPKGLNSEYDDQFLRIGGLSDISLHLYDYVRLNYQIDYACDATVSLSNETDQSLGIDSYEWFFTKEDGSIEISSEREPSITYSRSGDYFFKVWAYNSQRPNSYSEWYFDSIKVRIPEKPSPAFEVTDTVICAHKSLTLFNLSNSLHKNPEKAEKWVWTFGDGHTRTTTQREDIEYIFKNPGTYTVSLFYHNGFCDSTLVKNQYITVKGSPKPGFTVEDSIGCAPFKVTIADSSKEFVTKKEYFFSDVNEWVTVDKHTFTHDFMDTGFFIIVQKLSGIAGCVASMDTLTITVLPGVLKTDSVHILNATFTPDLVQLEDENETIELKWSSIKNAKEYEIQRDNLVIGLTDKLEFNWDASTPLKEWVFSVKAVDVCGNRSSSGRIGTPIILNGHIFGNNETASLRYTSYRNWPGEIQYSLWGGFENNFGLVQNKGEGNTFIDNGYAVQNEHKKCYVVQGRSATGVITKSNLFCLPYKPLLYIPNAITVNGDNLNDSFMPILFGLTDYKLSIYNRWGQEIYSSLNGAWFPEDEASGVYFYKVVCETEDGRSIFRTGTVNVLK